MIEEKRLSQEIINEFYSLSTTTISDAMNEMNLSGGLLGIDALVSNTHICGQAFTIHYAPDDKKNCAIKHVFIDDVKAGEVVVIDNEGRMDCSVWGDIMSYYGSKHNIVGTILNGVCRDINLIRQLKYPVYAKGTYMATGLHKVCVDKINESVNISGILVQPGDIICGDSDGVVVVPFDKAVDILKIAKIIVKREHEIFAKIDAGLPLAKIIM